MKNIRKTALLSVASCSLIAGTAIAQESSNYYSRNKYEAVTDRRQPEYDPEPIRLGAFLVKSQAVAGLTYNSNVLASNSDEQSDVVAHVGVEADARTNWSVHEIGGTISAYRNEYADLGDESANDLRGSLHGRLDVTRDFSLGGRVFAEQRVEPRTEPASSTGLKSPIEFTRTGFEGQANYYNDRVHWNNSAMVAETDYDDGTQIGTGLPVDEDFRDNQRTDLRSRLSYAVSPNLAVFGQGTISQQDYDNDQVMDGALRSRDSSGYTVSGGVDFELTSLVRGDVAVGYMNEDKDDDYFKDVDGLSIDGRMQWFPSRLTTVSFDAGRRVVDVGSFQAPTAISTRFGARVDHELYRNIILSGYGNVTSFDYQEIDQKDDTLDFGVSGIYKMNKRVHFEAFLRRLSRDSSGSAVTSDRNYDVNMVGVELRLHP